MLWVGTGYPPHPRGGAPRSEVLMFRIATVTLGLCALLACDPAVTPDPDPIPETCDEVEDAQDSALADIQACTTADECGQVLTGTSCGCTRDLVARVGADATLFYDLVEQSQALQCDSGLISTCDCPPANGFACDRGTCTWNYGAP